MSGLCGKVRRRIEVGVDCGCIFCFFFFQAEDGIRDHCVTGAQTCALPILILIPMQIVYYVFHIHVHVYVRQCIPVHVGSH